MQYDSVSLSFSIRRGECHLAVRPDRHPPAKIITRPPWEAFIPKNCPPG